MALADYQPEREQIFHKQSLLVSVRGLCLEDLSVLVRGNLAELQQLYAAIKQPDQYQIDDLLIMKLINQAPLMAAKIIALAADEPAGEEAASRLTVPLQVNILSAIARLTFEDIGGPKAFVAMVGQLVGNSLPDEMRATIQ
jgi:hypothetical protein